MKGLASLAIVQWRMQSTERSGEQAQTHSTLRPSLPRCWAPARLQLRFRHRKSGGGLVTCCGSPLPAPIGARASGLRELLGAVQLTLSGEHWSKSSLRGASGRCSQSYGLVLGCPVRSRELDSMVLAGSFQLEILNDSHGLWGLSSA